MKAGRSLQPRKSEVSTWWCRTDQESALQLIDRPFVIGDRVSAVQDKLSEPVKVPH